MTTPQSTPTPAATRRVIDTLEIPGTAGRVVILNERYMAGHRYTVAQEGAGVQDLQFGAPTIKKARQLAEAVVRAGTTA